MYKSNKSYSKPKSSRGAKRVVTRKGLLSRGKKRAAGQQTLDPALLHSIPASYDQNYSEDVSGSASKVCSTSSQAPDTAPSGDKLLSRDSHDQMISHFIDLFWWLNKHGIVEFNNRVRFIWNSKLDSYLMVISIREGDIPELSGTGSRFGHNKNA
jgi:hypothetical protein